MTDRPGSDFASPAPYHRRPDFTLSGALVQPSLNRVVRGNSEIPIEPKVMHVLVCLADRPGEAVTKAELGDLVWEGAIVSDKVLPRAISVLRKALDDDPHEPRIIRTISKVGYQLISPVGRVSGGSTQAALAIVPSPIASRGWHRRITVGALATIGIAAAAMWLGSGAPVAGPDAAFPARQLTTLPGHEIFPAVSADGSFVLFAWGGPEDESWNIYMTRTDGGEPVRLTDSPTMDLRPAISPDGGRLAYLSVDGTFGRMLIAPLEAGWPGGLQLGAATELLTFEFLPPGLEPWRMPNLSWSPDGRWLAVPTARDEMTSIGITAVHVETGERRVLTQPGPSNADVDAVYSPDGRWLAVTRFLGMSAAELFLLDLESGLERQLTTDGRVILGHTWRPDGSAIVFSSSRAGRFDLWAVPLSGGDPAWVPASGWNLKNPRLTSRGRLVYESWLYETNVWRTSLAGGTEADGTGPPPHRLIGSSHWDSEPSYSPDGSRIAFVSARSGSFEIWVAEADGETARQVTDLDASDVSFPRWSPDGSRLVFTVRRGGDSSIIALDLAGGEPRPLDTGRGAVANPVFNRRGDSVLFASRASGAWQIWRVPVSGGAAEQVTHEGGYFAFESFDGGTLVYTKQDRPGIWAAPLAGGGERLLVEGLMLGDWASWVVVSGGVVYVVRDPATGTAELWQFEFEAGDPSLFRRLGPLEQPDQAGLSISPDGAWLLYTRIDQTQSDLMLLGGRG